MVDSESYAAQERELQKRLPNVSREVIRHFLVQHRGNLEECYQRLRTTTPQPLSPDMEPFFQEFGRTSTVSTSRPTLYHQSYQPPPNQYQHGPLHYQQRPLGRPQHDHRAMRRQLTWDPYPSHTLPNPRRPHTHVHGPPPDAHGLMHRPPPDSHGLMHRPPPDSHGLMHRPPPDSHGLMHRPPPDSHGLMHRPPPDSHGLMHRPPPDSHGLMHRPPPDSHGLMHRPPPDAHGLMHRPPPDAQGLMHRPPPDAQGLMYTSGAAGMPQVERAPEYNWTQYAHTPHSVYDAQPGTWSMSLPRMRERAPSNAVVYAANIFQAQQQQLEDLHTFHERQYQHLAYTKQTVDNRKHQLSRLRVEVSAIPTEQHIDELREVIQTLEIDLQEARNDLQVHEMQSKMKAEQDLYTDEGVRWYCADCSFLNHPLMTLCEHCDIPRSRSKS